MLTKIAAPISVALLAGCSLLFGGGPTPGSVMVHGASLGSSGVAQSYVVHAGGGIPEFRSPRPGTIQNMRILIISNTFDSALGVALRINGTPTSLVATIPAGSTSAIDVGGAVQVTDGDRVSVVANGSASAGRIIQLSVSYEIR